MATLNKYQGYFISKTIRVVGLDIHNTMFAEGDIVRLFAQEDKSVKVMLDNNSQYKVLGYLHHEDSQPIHLVLDKYENPNNKDDMLSHIGCTIEVGDAKEVMIEIDFFNVSDKSKRFIYDVKEILDEIPGRVKKINDEFLWSGESEQNDEINNTVDEME